MNHLDFSQQNGGLVEIYIILYHYIIIGIYWDNLNKL